MLNNEADNLV